MRPSIPFARPHRLWLGCLLAATLPAHAAEPAADAPAEAPAVEAPAVPAPAADATPAAESPIAAEPVAEAAPAAAEPPPSPWSGSAGLGMVQTRGNTRTGSINAKLALGWHTPKWGNDFGASAYSGSRGKTTSDERYGLADKLSRNFGERHYAFAASGYDNDRFAGIAERYTLSVGYGRHLVTTKTQTLDAELGLGGNRTREQDDRRFVVHGIATLGGKYRWAISASSEFVQTLRTEYATNNVYVNPVSSLKLTIVGALFAAIDAEIRYNSKAPDATRHTDLITTINLGYRFGTP